MDHLYFDSGICMIDLSDGGRIVEIDDDFAGMTGYQPASFPLGVLTYRAFIENDGRSAVYQKIEEAVDNQEIISVKHRMKAQDYSVFDVSCFCKRLENNIAMLVVRKEEAGDKSKYDSLTSLYTRKGAVEKMQELLKGNPSGEFYTVLVHLGNTGQMIEEYGTSFVLAVLTSVSMQLQNFFRDFGENVVLGRIHKDTFLVFLQWKDREKVVDYVRWVYDGLSHSYYGRNRAVTPGILIGICQNPEEEQQAEYGIARAENAVQYGREHGGQVIVYDPSMARPKNELEAGEALHQLEGEQLANYDKYFLSFAVSLLSNSRDLDSSSDMVIQHIGWRYRFDDVLIAEFRGNSNMAITNKWSRGQGVLFDLDEVANIDAWDGFIAGFDENGVCIVPDISRVPFSKRDKEFFAEGKIGGFINILLHSNDRPIGYISCTTREASEQWQAETVNTLVQLSKIIASFVALRIQRRKDKKKIESLSRESLTGLYQYTAFQKKVQQVLQRFDAEKAYAFTYSDISNFSYLNENFGYHEGNKVLREFARRVKVDNEENVILCRLEADRFIVFSMRDTEEQILNRVKKVNDEFAEYLQERYPQSDLHINSGIYFVKDPRVRFFRMVDAANHARKYVKKNHFETTCIFTEELRMQRQNVLKVVGSIQDAIKEGQIEAFLQPKFSMNDRTVIGAEALVRWRNPDNTYRYPDQFVPILEDAGFIVDVDICIYEQVLRALVKWKQDEKKLIPISVNFSRLHFRNQRGFEKIIDMAKKYQVEPKYIEIEITESTFSSNRSNLYRQMAVLRENGFKIDIDDFGTGYSSLNMLLSAPVDIVKVDKSFIDNYQSNEQREYINQIGNLILSARKNIIFEGVETEEQIDLLTNYGYDQAQGYLFSKPIPLAEFEKKYIY